MRSIRWGILGTGWIAGAFAEGLRNAPGAVLAAVASRSAVNAQAFARRFGATTAHDRYEALLDDPSVDVIYIATPNEYHKTHCLMAIAAGKSVLCEKPFALDAAESREVIEAARSRGVFCMEGMWSRCAPAFKQALAELRSGHIGEPFYLDAQLGFAKQPDPGSRLFEGPGAGALLDLAVYPLALAQAVFGPPQSVAATRVRGPSGADVHVSALLGYRDGHSASVSASLRSELRNAARLHGPLGVLELHAPLYFCERYSITPSHPAGEPAAVIPSAMRQFKQHRALRPTLDRLRGLRNSARLKVMRHYPAGSGYSVEAIEVMRCLRSGENESPDMPLDDTLAVMETVDRIRAVWNR